MRLLVSYLSGVSAMYPQYNQGYGYPQQMYNSYANSGYNQYRGYQQPQQFQNQFCYASSTPCPSTSICLPTQHYGCASNSYCVPQGQFACPQNSICPPNYNCGQYQQPQYQVCQMGPQTRQCGQHAICIPAPGYPCANHVQYCAPSHGVSCPQTSVCPTGASVCNQPVAQSSSKTTRATKVAENGDTDADDEDEPDDLDSSKESRRRKPKKQPTVYNRKEFTTVTRHVTEHHQPAHQFYHQHQNHQCFNYCWNGVRRVCC
jgi:hypothetical protein